MTNVSHHNTSLFLGGLPVGEENPPSDYQETAGDVRVTDESSVWAELRTELNVSAGGTHFLSRVPSNETRPV